MPHFLGGHGNDIQIALVGESDRTRIQGTSCSFRAISNVHGAIRTPSDNGVS